LLALPQGDRPPDFCNDLTGQSSHSFRAAVTWQNDRKFIATESRDEIGISQHRRQPLRYGHQHLVASEMPKAVIDGLEPIEVEQHHRKRRSVALQPPHALAEMLVEPCSIIEPRQRIVMRKVRD